MKASIAFFCALLLAVPVFAKEAQCMEVDQGSDRMVELMGQDYVVRDQRTEVHSTEFIGVGLAIGVSGNILGVLPGSSAALVSIPVGSVILRVNGVPTEYLSRDGIVESIRGSEGEEGTAVSISFRLPDGLIEEYILTRAKVRVNEDFVVLRMCK